ncbi:antichymotrypsin-2-like [Photinus pyralis]|uniref:Serpin domain-containing protein n=2 Tax=Photinus pyralis TaxID=7054 RepID=A0A1Y1JWP8_PHOPY|nr:antichymotrypsin-2-like [Photinus pyralis]
MKLILLCLVAVGALDVFQESNLKFSSNLYQELGKTNDGDFVVCSLSLQLILGLLHVAAQGETAGQLAEGLHLPNNVSETLQIFGNATPQVERNVRHFVANIVNKVYVHEKFAIEPRFRDVAADVFRADIENVNFNEKEATSAQINNWMEGKTLNNIKNFVTGRDISPDSQVMLINSIYLQGVWENAFTSTKKQRFYTNHSNFFEIDMMEQKKVFSYYESEKLHAKMLKMKYQQSKYAMVIVLPNDQAGLSRLEANMPETFREPHYISAQVQVRIPKFKVNAAIQLIPILQEMGIRDVFATSANLRGMGEPQVYVNQIVQRNYVDVNENGTIAVSATRASARLGRPRKVQEREFVADHPFIYYVRSPVGIVFVGRFTGIHL